ncbi:MAG: glycosyltransferase, partial [Planctomycetota bacterium]
MTDYLAIYQSAFSTPGYACVTDQEFRYVYACDAISALGPHAESLLDVGTGRGDFLRIAQGTFPGLHLLGVDVGRFHQQPISHLNVDLCSDGGREVIQQLRFDVISCLDVLEHLPESDLAQVLSSLATACQWAVVTVANHSDMLDGVELHLTQRPAEWWRSLLGDFFEITAEAEHYAGTLYAFRLRSKRAIRCSIVMATYNKARLLDLSLQSIAQQSPPFGYEVIVVDDGSADETRAVCLKHGVRYAYLDRPYYCNPSKA